MASHDLQEPLRKIRAFGDRLKSLCGNSLPDEGSRYLDRMLFSAARMQKLIGSLLTLARVCQEAAFFVPTDLNAIAAETLEALDEAIERTKATIHLSVLPTIKADAVQMGLLFQNLISNALKFHGSDKCPEITIFSRSCSGLTSTLEARWEIVFEDKGIGFEERHKERMFGVFQRLNSKDQYEGSGLGLSICRRIVTRHQGFISVDSRLGEGSTFTVNLPCDASGSRTATGLSQASR
jgi:light-regulated signal transduction histidine kinase (bacteriophytochrome)